MPYLLLLGFKSWAPVLIGKQGSLLFLCLKLHLHNASICQILAMTSDSLTPTKDPVPAPRSGSSQQSAVSPCGFTYMCAWIPSASTLLSAQTPVSFAELKVVWVDHCWILFCPPHHVLLIAPLRGPPWCGWVTFQANRILPHFVQVRMAKHRLIHK